MKSTLWVGEIIFDDEIQLRWMKSVSTADGRILFHLRCNRRFHLRQQISSLPRQGFHFLREFEFILQTNKNIFFVAQCEIRLRRVKFASTASG